MTLGMHRSITWIDEPSCVLLSLLPPWAFELLHVSDHYFDSQTGFLYGRRDTYDEKNMDG
ncbi:Protein of unknown function [Pyronema omphalodes CBS 100304]|uniref:Uncharacterized protein n=1 Tax=Pyronema omphalodes (strain CBS 100304) TaxID=1076935 RepID=U4L941_PYROM|nr:Protein of unknown function [Pyronema omphalodes CBS 100304]